MRAGAIPTVFVDHLHVRESLAHLTVVRGLVIVAGEAKKKRRSVEKRDRSHKYIRYRI